MTIARPEAADRQPSAVVFDAWRVLSDPEAVAVVCLIARRLRETDSVHGPSPVARLAARCPVPEAAVDELVTRAGRRALVRTGALVDSPGGMRLATSLARLGPIVVAVPPLQGRRPVAYIGPDSLWLLRTVWRHAPHGDAAVDLGTGTGFLAAALVSRHRRVLATEIAAEAAATAQLTLTMNRVRSRPATALVADVGAGLRPGSFSLVTANTPWIPGPLPGEGGRVFADGGAHGVELPARFVRESCELLAPGGVALVQCLDPRLPDGRRPLTDVCADVEDRGFGVELLPATGAGKEGEFVAARLVSRFPRGSSLRNVVVAVRRTRA